MRFLEKLVTDMVKESTGYNPRKLVRMVGGKNILAAEVGAALVGGAAAVMQQQKAGAQQPTPGPPHPGAAPPPPPGQWGATPPVPPGPPTASRATPPPPPIPGSAQPPAAAPPPPPIPTPASAGPGPEAEEPPQEVTYAIVRAMVAGALADGQLDPAEKDMILGRLGESGLASEQVSQIHKDLVIPPSPQELAVMAPDAEMREMLYRFAALVILAEGGVSELERRWLETLAQTFGIPADRQAALEAELSA